MIEKVKQTLSEKLLLALFIVLGLLAIYIFFILPQKCLFIKDYNPKEISFKEFFILSPYKIEKIIRLHPIIS